MGKYVNLNRSFTPILKNGEFNEEENELDLSLESLGLSNIKKWKQLLQLNRVIILRAWVSGLHS